MTEKLFQHDAYLKACSATVVDIVDNGIVLDRTVFYAQGGGQPGDIGHMVASGGRTITIVDTVLHRDTGAHLHLGEQGDILPEIGETVNASINWDRRYRLMRMHSCMHMLCAVIDAPVTGGSVSDGRARLDFDLPTPPDKEVIQQALEKVISSDQPMELRWISGQELRDQPELVRTMSVSPPIGDGDVRLVNFKGIDLQPCGGTHVSRSGEIGVVKVRKIEKKGRQNRRVIIEFA